MANIAEDAVKSVVTKLQSVAELSGKSFYILSDDELTAFSGLFPFPAVGVIYEGMRSAGEAGKTSGRNGLSAKLSINVVLIFKDQSDVIPMQLDTIKTEALALMDKIRNTLRDTQGPSMHKWEFVLETPAMSKKGVVVWMQRWTLPVLLTQGL